MELRRLLAVSERVRHAVVKEVLLGTGLVWSQWLVLDLLLDTPDLTPTQLARLLHLPPSTLTGVLAPLRRADLVRADPDRRDSRRLLLALTPTGAQLAARVRHGEGLYLSGLLAELTGDDVAAVTDGVRLLDRALAARDR
jgi:DNA-binding MarR family transcriptional regulator